MTDPDAETVRAVLAGELERYAELVEKYQEPAIRMAFSLLGNYEDARDVSQDAFVRAYQALARFRGASTFSTWLYRIIVNACKDAGRRRSRQPETGLRAREAPVDDAERDDPLFDAADHAATPSEQAANEELGHRLSSAIRKLPMKQRTAFLLHHVHGLPLAEVAMVMACRSGTVKAHVFRATASLRVALDPWLAQERA